jgi:hypothetical protein
MKNSNIFTINLNQNNNYMNCIYLPSCNNNNIKDLLSLYYHKISNDYINNCQNLDNLNIYDNINIINNNNNFWKANNLNINSNQFFSNSNANSNKENLEKICPTNINQTFGTITFKFIVIIIILLCGIVSLFMIFAFLNFKREEIMIIII